MAEDEWYTVALPVLAFIHDNKKPMGFPTVGEVAEGTGLDPLAVAEAVDQLHGARYLTGGARKMMTGGDARPWFIEGSGLAEKGLRTIGAWPTDDPYEALLELLDRQISAAPDDQTRTKLATLKSTLATVGKSTVSGLLVALATGGIHF